MYGIASTRLRTRLLTFPGMPLSSHNCNDRRCLYFTRNACERKINSCKTLSRTVGARVHSSDRQLLLTSNFLPDLRKHTQNRHLGKSSRWIRIRYTMISSPTPYLCIHGCNCRIDGETLVIILYKYFYYQVASPNPNLNPRG